MRWVSNRSTTRFLHVRCWHIASFRFYNISGGTADSGKPFARRANGFTAWQQNDPGFRA